MRSWLLAVKDISIHGNLPLRLTLKYTSRSCVTPIVLSRSTLFCSCLLVCAVPSSLNHAYRTVFVPVIDSILFTDICHASRVNRNFLLRTKSKKLPSIVTKNTLNQEPDQHQTYLSLRYHFHHDLTHRAPRATRACYSKLQPLPSFHGAKRICPPALHRRHDHPRRSLCRGAKSPVGE